ncbi:hypothetical protein, partial [Jannaschia marina]|uniref:hypothetical protein n=1 Tax=Jannaschia marina TaxID=2741674 RepID=UPI001ABA7E11
LNAAACRFLFAISSVSFSKTKMTSDRSSRQRPISREHLTVLAIKDLRAGLIDVIRAALQWKLVLWFISLSINTALIAAMLKQTGLWAFDQTISTILWLLTSGCVLSANAISAKEGDGYFRNIFFKVFAVAGAFEFVVVAYSFSLVVEIILLPVLMLLAALIAVAGREESHAPAKTLFEIVLLAIGVFILWNSVEQIISDPEDFFTTATGRNFVLPGFLAVGSIPIFYIWYCYSHIESARIAINQKNYQSAELKNYARKRFFLIFMARPWLLRRAVRQFHLQAKELDDVDTIIFDILQSLREKEDPPDVSPDEGWSPYLARDFLADYGLRTNDYHRGAGEDHWANSGYVDLDEHLVPSNCAFYLTGRKGVVTELKLTARFLDKFDGHAALEVFRDIVDELCERATGAESVDTQAMLPSLDSFDTRVDLSNTELRCYCERFPGDNGAHISVTLSR